MVHIDVFRHSMTTEERGIRKSRSFNLKKMLSDVPIPGRQSHSFVGDIGHGNSLVESIDDDRSHLIKTPIGGKQYLPFLESEAPEIMARSPLSRLNMGESATSTPGTPLPSSELEMLKERYSKLLLGEDMSGGGKGVSSALALSNAITNLSASLFGEHRKLEPLPPDRKQKWRREMDWLLAVTDYIVELVPSQQICNGKSMEIMVTEQRKDLKMNIPGLRRIDAELIKCLDDFKDQNEFWYISKDAIESEKGVQRDGKWWLPTVKVPPNGLSESTRKLLEAKKSKVGQVLKASMITNAQVLTEMEIPDDYIESLPKNGRASLGDIVYKNITLEFFDPEQFLLTMDLTSEHKVLDLKNRIEASIVIWKRKMHQKDGKSSWGSAVSLEKRELFEDRAETILQLLKQRFPGLPQSSLDISKIQFNKDVGYAILESYSRILESLAYALLTRIEDVLYADSISRDPSLAITKMRASPSRDPSPSPKASGMSSPLDQEFEKEQEKVNSAAGTPTSLSNSNSNSVTLFDVMGWNVEQVESGLKKSNSLLSLEDFLKDENNEKTLTKATNVASAKKFSYIDKVESGLRSPTSRH